MPEPIIQVDRVFKKFRRGEIYDSLRDLIPAVTGKYFRNSSKLSEKREFWALEDVSFNVERGEAVGIIGRNGAGKSTMLKILSGVMKPNRGSIRVGGRLSALIEIGAGFHPDLTGRENIFLNGAILGMTRKEIQSKFDNIVEFAGIGPFVDTPVKRYSSGMYARLGFSVAAHVEPEILLVDEVLSVGDYIFQTRCLQRMNEIRSSGATVLFVSHNLQAVSELCSRSVLLDQGKVVADDKTQNVVRYYLEQSQSSRDDAAQKEAYITRVTLLGRNGPQVKFVAGDKAWLEIEFASNAALENVSIAVEIRDEAYYPIFDISSERLGHQNWTLKPGDVHRLCFELDLHLAYGTFHFGVHVRRSDIAKGYDFWFPSATIYVTMAHDIRGAANLYPRIVPLRTDAESDPDRTGGRQIE